MVQIFVFCGAFNDAHKSSNDPKLLKIKDAAASCAGVFQLLGSVVPSAARPDPGCGLSPPAGQVGTRRIWVQTPGASNRAAPLTCCLV